MAIVKRDLGNVRGDYVPTGTTEQILLGDGSSEDITEFLKKNTNSIAIATVETTGIVKPDGTSVRISDDGTISVSAATVEEAGIVKPDDSTISVDDDGTITVVGIKGTIGSSTAPVYVNENVVTKVNQSSLGNTFGVVPFVSDEGIMEVGSIIDFHGTNESESEFDVRVKVPTDITDIEVELPDKNGRLLVEDDLALVLSDNGTNELDNIVIDTGGFKNSVSGWRKIEFNRGFYELPRIYLQVPPLYAADVRNVTLKNFEFNLYKYSVSSDEIKLVDSSDSIEVHWVAIENGDDPV